MKKRSTSKVALPVVAERSSVQSVDVAATNVQAMALDLGNGYSNLLADGGIAADWRSVQGVISDASRLKDLPFDHCIRLADERWRVFGDEAYTYAPRTLEDYPAINRYTSPWYKRLFAYALHRAYGLRLSQQPFCPTVILSVPAAQYSNDLVVQNIRRNLIGLYHICSTLDTILSVQIEETALRIIPEGAGSFIAAASADNPALQQGLWYIVDVGYLTSDVVAFRNGDYVPDLAVSDNEAGISQVARQVARWIAGTQGTDLLASEIDAQLGCDSVLIQTMPVSIKEIRTQALGDLGERLGRFITQASAGQNLAGVLLTGGGAELVRDYIRANRLPPITMAPNPRRANVEGAFKLAME